MSVLRRVQQRALLVHDGTTCLVKLLTQLKKEGYEVTTCNKAKIAATLLWEKKDEFDKIIVSDFPMDHDKDGFTHLVRLALEMNLPMSRFIARNVENSKDKGKTLHQQQHGGGCGSSNSQKRKHTEERDEKKQRKLKWIPELHQMFVDAVNKLGPQAVPSKILEAMDVPSKLLEAMNVPELTRDNISSHLQKYRKEQKKLGEKELGEVPQQQQQQGNNINNSSDENASFDPLLSILNGSDLQTLAPQNVIPAMVDSEEVVANTAINNWMDQVANLGPLSMTFDEFKALYATDQPNMGPHHQVDANVQSERGAENTAPTFFTEQNSDDLSFTDIQEFARQWFGKK